MISQHDLVALQDIHAADQGLLARPAGAGQRRPAGLRLPVRRSERRGEGAYRYSAFVFDRSSIELDRSMVYLVSDAAGRLRHKPLVGLFRTLRGTADGGVHVRVDQRADRPGPRRSRIGPLG